MPDIEGLIYDLDELIKVAVAKSESKCASCGEGIHRVPKTQVLFHPTMPQFTEWMHDNPDHGVWCHGGYTNKLTVGKPKITIEEVRKIVDNYRD